MVFIIVAFAVYILTFYVFFRIDNITVKGTSLYDPEQVIAVSGMKKGENLFRTDTSQVEQNLSGFMVYADEIKVRRKLPSSIVITVTEAEPLIILNRTDGIFLYQKAERVLEGDMTAPRNGLLIVKGFEIKDETPNSPLESKDNLKGKILEDISEGLENAGLSDVLSVDMTDRTDIKLNYDNRIEIRLGSSYDISYKLIIQKQLYNLLKILMTVRIRELLFIIRQQAVCRLLQMKQSISLKKIPTAETIRMALTAIRIRSRRLMRIIKTMKI